MTYQVSASFLNDGEQNKAQMASLGQNLKNLQTKLRKHRDNAVEENEKPIDPNQKGRQNATRFCGFCRSNGHTRSFCWKKIRDKEIKKLQNQDTVEKKCTITHDHNKKRGPSHGPENCNGRNDDNGAMFSTHNLTQEKNFNQAIRVITTLAEIDHLGEGTTRITALIDTLITRQDHHTS